MMTTMRAETTATTVVMPSSGAVARTRSGRENSDLHVT